MKYTRLTIPANECRLLTSPKKRTTTRDKDTVRVNQTSSRQVQDRNAKRRVNRVYW